MKNLYENIKVLLELQIMYLKTRQRAVKKNNTLVVNKIDELMKDIEIMRSKMESGEWIVESDDEE
jgi:hypothetical protein